MMKKMLLFFVLALVLFLASCGESPDTYLMGDIIVQSDEGARVWLNNNNVGTVDSTGELTIPRVRAGTHTLRARVDGKEDIVKQIIVIP